MAYKVKIENVEENKKAPYLSYNHNDANQIKVIPFKTVTTMSYNTGTEAFTAFIMDCRIKDFFLGFEETDKELIFYEYDGGGNTKVILKKWKDFDKYAQIKWTLIDESDSNKNKTFGTKQEVIDYFKENNNIDYVEVFFDDSHPDTMYFGRTGNVISRTGNIIGVVKITYDYNNPKDDKYLDKMFKLSKRNMNIEENEPME